MFWIFFLNFVIRTPTLLQQNYITWEIFLMKVSLFIITSIFISFSSLLFFSWLGLVHFNLVQSESNFCPKQNKNWSFLNRNYAVVKIFVNFVQTIMFLSVLKPKIDRFCQMFSLEKCVFWAFFNHRNLLKYAEFTYFHSVIANMNSLFNGSNYLIVFHLTKNSNRKISMFFLLVWSIP